MSLTESRATTCRALAWVLAWIALAWPLDARADIERYAIIVGEDHEGSLTHSARTNAERMYETLRELGGFRPDDIALLEHATADELRATLQAMTARIRRANARPNSRSWLLVYYSGHADRHALQLGKTSLSLRELSHLTGESGAQLRLLMLDTCRYGARDSAAFELSSEEYPEGVAWLAASSAALHTQPADSVPGTSVTRALVSGMLGAADRDRNGAISLDELYLHALRVTSPRADGAEPTTFRYDARGRGELPLSEPERYGARRSHVYFPLGQSYIVQHDNPDGAVVAELDPDTRPRVLSLRPGRYFVRARDPSTLFEGSLYARAGAAQRIDLEAFTRIEYARLVRSEHRGDAGSSISHQLEIGAAARSTLPNAETLCLGAALGYGFDVRGFGARARLGLCFSQFEHAELRARVRAQDLEVRVYRAWDLAIVSFELGLTGGVVWFNQQFTGGTDTPARNSIVPYAALGTRFGVDLMRGFYTGTDLAAELHLLPLQRDATTGERRVAGFALRASLAIGKHF